MWQVRHINILDHVITPNHDNLIKSVTVCDYNISDHYSVECNMDLLVSHPKARFAMKRSLNNIDMDVFIEDLCIVNDRLLSKNFGDTNEIVFNNNNNNNICLKSNIQTSSVDYAPLHLILHYVSC